MPSIHPKLIRGSQEWTQRVLELINRDCMDDFAELCELMGVPLTKTGGGQTASGAAHDRHQVLFAYSTADV